MFNVLLAMDTAERLLRREELMASRRPEARQGPDGVGGGPAGLLLCSLPAERRLSVPALRKIEVERRAAVVADVPVVAQAGVRVPPSAEPRRRWLRQRLIQLLQEDMAPCGALDGSTSEALVECFERETGKLFTASPGVSVQSRVSGMGRVLSNILKEEVLRPTLACHTGKAGLVRWNRRPRGPRVDVAAWRQAAEVSQASMTPVPRLRERVAAVNQELVAWVRTHRHLVPVASEDVLQWESGVALLLLWEVDHQHEFITEGGGGMTLRLQAFSRRLQARVPGDPELREWLRWRDVAAPLMPGLAVSHHVRWSLRVSPPGAKEPRGWYDEFLMRWQQYVRKLAGPPGAGRLGGGAVGSTEDPSSSSTSTATGPVAPRATGQPTTSLFQGRRGTGSLPAEAEAGLSRRRQTPTLEG